MTDGRLALARDVLAAWPRCVDHPENYATDADGTHGTRTLCGACGRWDAALRLLLDVIYHAPATDFAESPRPLTLDDIRNADRALMDLGTPMFPEWARRRGLIR